MKIATDGKSYATEISTEKIQLIIIQTHKCITYTVSYPLCQLKHT